MLLGHQRGIAMYIKVPGFSVNFFGPFLYSFVEYELEFAMLLIEILILSIFIPQD